MRFHFQKSLSILTPMRITAREDEETLYWDAQFFIELIQ
jgi:hypothetical protein